ncbi:MAG: hypothetical protein HF308_18055 [Ignavibacteria bacterium]|nr:hypothetical protein [Ignavibacteria bacterium]MCU7522575.1 hypothetical protein [Ignavibacteria bacterium]MCU7526385.1 hypothetical protein [Ignavibacteria bacterium]HEX2961107.1 hypothetical protein [Ignavibacteriales bacterium]
MKVRDISRRMIGRAAVIIEADDFPVYNGMLGWIEEDVKYGLVFNPAVNRMPNNGKSMLSIPLKPDDLIEFVD